MLHSTVAARAVAEQMVTRWQSVLGNDVDVVLGGSLVSGFFIWDDETKVIDVDVRFLVDDDKILDPQMHSRIETATGLTYRKQIMIGNPEDPSDPVSDGVLVEARFNADGIAIPLEVEGCIRNRSYESWARFYREVFTADEVDTIIKRKAHLKQHGTKDEYKAYKTWIRREADRRIVESGLAKAPQAISPVA
jgi:hypothetical protein